MADNDDLKAKIERLEAELEALRNRQDVQVQNGSASIGDHAKSVGAGGVLIEGGVYIGPPAQDPKKSLAIYRRVLMQTTASLPLRGVDVGASDLTVAQKVIGLTSVYISLDTKSKFHQMKEADQGGLYVHQAEPREISALEAVIMMRRLVLLGDPGSGKTTFVNFLAHCLAANALEPDAGWVKHLPGWPAEESKILPIVVILRDFARSLPQPLPGRAEPHHLWDFILARLQSQNLKFAADSVHDQLEAGQALILLDGLDEVSSQEQRLFIRDAVRVFIQRYPDNRYLVTCRVLSYQPPASDQEPELRLVELPNFELAPFDEEKIDTFIQGWYAEQARLGNVLSSDTDDLSRSLQAAVRRPDLWRLAPNPLLLTVMALVHTHKSRLPDTRAQLYEETVDILLFRWEQLKLSGGKDAPQLRQLLEQAGRLDVDLKNVLGELAYEAHAQIGTDSDGDKLADIGELRLQKALAVLKGGDFNWARQVIEVMRLRAGLLLERAPEVFTFPHRTFQEYLAGAHLAAKVNFAREGCQLAGQGNQWRDVILLAVGRLVYHSGDQYKPLALVGELCPGQVSDDGVAWQQAWLAGDVLLEIGVTRVMDSALGRDLLQRLRERLVALLEGGKLATIERARAGDTLAQLGDPRFDSEHWHLPAEPILGFVEIPEGKFLIGSDPDNDPDSYGDEQPRHEVHLPAFYIARYPVTAAQFRSFVDESGYEFNRWQWNTLPNHPVDNVTWDDSLEYCRWLHDRLSAVSRQRLADSNLDPTERAFWQGLASDNLQVTLPSEAEWEKAARGKDGRIYPWLDNYDSCRANTFETGIGSTSAVGCFPGGASPYGVLDLSGNVWEWTRSKLVKYPYQAEDGREDSSGDSLRVLRGGSFFNGRRLARCAARDGYDPSYGDDYIGFRVVVSQSRL